MPRFEASSQCSDRLLEFVAAGGVGVLLGSSDEKAASLGQAFHAVYTQELDQRRSSMSTESRRNFLASSGKLILGTVEDLERQAAP